MKILDAIFISSLVAAAQNHFVFTLYHLVCIIISSLYHIIKISHNVPKIFIWYRVATAQQHVVVGRATVCVVLQCVAVCCSVLLLLSLAGKFWQKRCYVWCLGSRPYESLTPLQHTATTHTHTHTQTHARSRIRMKPNSTQQTQC